METVNTFPTATATGGATFTLSDGPATYAAFVRDVAAEVVRQLEERRADPVLVSQRRAYWMFGRGNVDRWRREGRLTAHKRPGKVEYFTAELRELARTEQDYVGNAAARGRAAVVSRRDKNKTFGV